MSDKYLRDGRQQLLNSLGSEQCWGWSPAIDFCQLLHDRLEKRPPQASVPAAKAAAREDTTAGRAPSPTVPAAAVRSAALDLDAMMAQITLGKSKPDSATAEAPTAASSAHILLAGAADIRHIFRTLATCRLREVEQSKASGESHSASPVAPPRTYHFYLYEPNLRVHCRHLFFLQWLLDSTFALEQLEERVLMFLDIFGNACNREITAAQARGVTQRVVNAMMSGTTSPAAAAPETGKGGATLQNMVDFSELKMKEKDFVEQQLLHWGRDQSHSAIESQWSARVRQEMADRYDNRDNIIDWDFVFHLADYTNLLKFPEYREWRNTGIAFDPSHINPRRGFDYTFPVPNKTLCHFDRQGRGTYTGDIKNGPFFALGAQTENEHIRHRTTDGTCKYGNGVVAMHNTRAWLYTLLTGAPWPWSDHKFAWDDDAHYNYLPPGTPQGVELQTQFPDVRFHFIGLDWERFLLHVDVGRIPKMDAAFFGTSCSHLLTPAFLRNAMAPDGLVIMETAKFVVDAEEEAKKAFIAKLKDMAQTGGWHHDLRLTATLHADQPKARPCDGATTDAARIAQDRYNMPFQLVFVASAD